MIQVCVVDEIAYRRVGTKRITVSRKSFPFVIIYCSRFADTRSKTGIQFAATYQIAREQISTNSISEALIFPDASS